VSHPAERRPRDLKKYNVIFTPEVLLEHEQALYDRPLKLIASKEWNFKGKRLTVILYGFKRVAHSNPKVRDQYRLAIAYGKRILHSALILHMGD
jgi:hypothetical protein